MNAATRICLLRFASNAMCTLNKLCGILVTFRINLQRITNMHTINNTIRLLVDQSIAVKLVVMTQLGTNQVKFDPETPTKTSTRPLSWLLVDDLLIMWVYC
ncbi:DnaJ-like protein [Batrachochytrium dendrobatidis]